MWYRGIPDRNKVPYYKIDPKKQEFTPVAWQV